MLLPETVNYPEVTVKLTRAEFEALGEYSCTLPTGTTIGRRWKRNQNAYRQPVCAHLHPWDGYKEPSFRGDNWWMGEYALDPKAKLLPDGRPATYLIRWSKIELSPT
jgi:hypothetical protein